MKFQKQQAIYLQIGEYICDGILNGKWSGGEKIPSVREMAVGVEVNPNTVMRTYADLQQKGIIANQRGIGFFVADDAEDTIRTLKRNAFMKEDLPRLFRTMRLLDIPFSELETYYVAHGLTKDTG